LVVVLILPVKAIFCDDRLRAGGSHEPHHSLCPLPVFRAAESPGQDATFLLQQGLPAGQKGPVPLKKKRDQVELS
jgi:hypothetical protein